MPSRKKRTIKRVLVANRGEIAIRIFRACKELDIATVAIFSEIDADALHARYADEAFLLGPAAPSASYLNIEKILEIARRTKTDAIHPGYGFLAENSGFAKAVEEAGMIWIGPPPSAIVAMGDKVSARKAAASVGVESVPGTSKPIKGPSEVTKFGQKHGWPVALKAAHGGGGRGFRVVPSEKEAAAALEGAAREAQMAFGNPEIYLERYLEAPRHVEIQVLGDSYGNMIHLGERDCSLQRRHQKLLEESPSPVVDEDLRARMGDAAVRAAQAAGYSSAGTVEFLVEPDGDGYRFWFLEMNTRLQVEHPVTELVTGVDLAKQMILVAQGEKLGITQQDISLTGHAIEFRINAEDPARNFLPTPAVITAYEEPSGPGVRIDAGVVAGSSIPQTYDSLIAKLIVYGSDRTEAIARGRRALDELVVEGPKTTIPFHKLVLSSDWFARGDFSTGTVERHMDLSQLPAPTARARTSAAAEAQTGERRMVVQLDGKRFDVSFRESLGPGRTKPKPPDLTKGSRDGGSGEVLTAPMQGTIIKTLAAEGDPVKAGEAVIVLEAMKMENLIFCHRDGTLKELKVKAGQTVPAGAQLAVIA